MLNSPLWVTNPRQQIAYLAVKNWTHLYVPDALLGVYSTDELDPGLDKSQSRPRTATEAAQAAQQTPSPARTEHHENHVLDLETIARGEGGPDERMEKLAQAWQGLGRDERRAIGEGELRRLQSIASAEDA